MRHASTVGPQPHLSPHLEERQPSKAARGFVYGTLFSLLLWACIIYGIYAAV